MTMLLPTSEAEASAMVADAMARAAPLAIEGNATKRPIGRPLQTQATLSSRALSGITLYEPAEMVIGARAGTPVADIETALAAKGQMLPFEPIDYRPLLGTSGEPTIGAVVAGNLSGPRRIMAGACRDSLIGVRFVNGRGQAVKSGGRVMKNVTGLDLAKLMAGSWGTLGFLTEVIFKVLPRPETEATLVLHGLDDAAAVTALAAALGSPFDVSGAAYMPAGTGGDRSRTLVRLENVPQSVAYRLGELRQLLAAPAQEVVEGAASAALWREIRDARLLAEPADRAIWRLSVAPSRAPALLRQVRAELDVRALLDWGGGLVWLSVLAAGDAGAATIRAAVGAARGHATLIRAPDAVRAAIDVFQPLAAPLMRVQGGIKTAHDPAGIFSPGRMYAGL